MRKNTTALLLAVSLMAVAGCAKKQKPEDLPPPPVGAEGNTGANTTPAGPAPAMRWPRSWQRGPRSIRSS